ncbi:sodium/hydrogen exchanger 8-like isoform X1 [Branchiostoma floridae x Branchiostoma belcheri]
MGEPDLAADLSATLLHILANDSLSNLTQANYTNVSASTAKPAPPPAPTLPGVPEDEAAGLEQSMSMTMFFICIMLALCIMLVHLLIKTRFHYLPESVAIVFLGAVVGLIIKLMNKLELGNWTREEAFHPTTFFLVMLPPIIFESGYSLHKGNFFQNMGSIMLFAVIGTILSSLVIGGGIYLLGKAGVAFELTLGESFAFGSLISAIDPVATIAIFHALGVDPILNMLVFGESILNDAVSIVLANTVIMLTAPSMADVDSTTAFFLMVGNFLKMFFASAAIGVSFAVISALLLKHINLQRTPSLEFSIMMIFAYTPYVLAEGLKLSGIMAILFCGIVMSHYTHYNLSPVTQITIQQTFRTMAFLAETCVFAYLGLAIFSFRHNFKPAFVVWSIVLCLLGRAVNIFPLSYIVNIFRDHKITKKMQFVMWFSGLRGAIAYALSLHLELEGEKRHVIITTTLIIVLFTILFLGGSTMPLMKLIKVDSRQKVTKEVTLSKTEELGNAIESEHLSELTEEEYEVNFVKPNLKGFMRIDAKYLVPALTRRFTHQELREGQTHMKQLTNQWYQEVRGPAMESDEEVDSAETDRLTTTTQF